jgi:tetratricopeptide (TPR) repeat protein
MTRTIARLGTTLALLSLTACAHHARQAPAAPSGPDSSAGDVAYARARALLAAGDTLRAEQYALLALRHGHPEREVIVPLVQACLASSRLRAALVYAEPFLRRNPEHVRLRYLVATVHLGLGHASIAERELARVSARWPDLPEAHYLRGVIARDAFGDLDAARMRFERDLALAPDGGHAPELRAWLTEQPFETAPDAAR